MGSQAFNQNAWAGYFGVTSQNAKVDEVTGWAAINLATHAPAGFWSAVHSTGKDVRITDSAGTTAYSCELVAFDSGAQTGWLYFDASLLSISSDITWRVYAGNASATAPAATDPLGREAVWPANQRRMYHCEEDPTGSAPQLIDSTAGRYHGTSSNMESGDAATQAIGKGWAFDGSNEQADCGKVGANDQGWEVPGGFTNTGLANDAALDCWWLGDHTNSLVKQISRDGVLLSSFSVGGTPQGIAVDTSDDTLFVAIYSTSTIEHYTKTGTLLGSWSHGANAPNGMDYEAATDSLWIARDSTNTIRRFSKAGSLLETVTVTGKTLIDGVAYDSATDELLVSTDAVGDFNIYRVTASGGSAGTVTATYLTTINLEDIAIRAGEIYFNADAGFHSSRPGGNRVWKLWSSESVFSRTLMFFLDITASTPADAMIVQGTPILTGGATSGAGYGVFNNGTTTLRMFIKGNGASVNGDRTVSSGRALTVCVFDHTAKEMRVYQSGSQISTAISISTVTGPTDAGGRFSLGNNIDEVTARFGAFELDELMEFTVAQSNNWITTTHNMLNGNATFWSAGTWTAVVPTGRANFLTLLGVS